jgi:hypothetical protein
LWLACVAEVDEHKDLVVGHDLRPQSKGKQKLAWTLQGFAE